MTHSSWRQNCLCSYRATSVAALVVLALTTCGCSLFVMAGKMMSDMKTKSALEQNAGVDLAETQQKLLVVCKTPTLVRGDFPTVEYDLNELINQKLKRNGIQTVATGDVAKWFDRNGGEFDRPEELAEDFDCEYIAVINLRELSFYEDNSPDMYRGKAVGQISVYEVQEIGDLKRTSQVFTGEFRTTHPRFAPIAKHQMSKRLFEKKFVGHLSSQIAKQFHDYRRGDDF